MSSTGGKLDTDCAKMPSTSDKNPSEPTYSYEYNRTFLYLAASIANLAALTCGLAIGWSSPVLPKLESNSSIFINTSSHHRFQLTPNEESWIGSLLPVGAILGPFLIGLTVDRIGRKASLQLSALPFIGGFLLAAYANHVYHLYATRFLCGIATGAVFTVLPMYIGEIADDGVRGALGSFMQLFITIGMLMAFSIGPFITLRLFNWICAVFPVIFIVVFTIFIPESPYYLVKSQINRHIYQQALMRLRGVTNLVVIQSELNRIEQSTSATINKLSLVDILKTPVLFKCLLLSIALVTFQQLSGICVILFYAQSIFTDAGSQLAPEVATILIGVVQLVASAATPLLVERYGKRRLLIGSAGGMMLSLGVLGCYFQLAKTAAFGWLPVVCLTAYIIVYCLGFGPLPWAVLGELFPVEAKSTSSTLTTSICWTLSFLLTKYFVWISLTIGKSGCFYLFSACCLVAGATVHRYLPETSGKSVAEIQSVFHQN